MTFSRHQPHFFVFLLIVSLTLSNAATAGKLYKWVDENGKVFFSDKVQPKHSKHAREELDEEGRVIATKEAAKTPEQLAQYKKILALKEQQQQLLDAQISKDNALIKTYQTESDIDNLLKSKLQTIDSHIKIASGQTETLKEQLLTYQKAAAKHERDGKTIPKKTQENLTTAQTQFDKNIQKIDALKAQKIDLSNELAADKERLVYLNRLPESDHVINAERPLSLSLGEINCVSNCHDSWQRAVRFVEQNAETKVTFHSPNLVLTASPRNSEKVSFTLSKSSSDKKLYLDFHCKDTSVGNKTCKNERLQTLAEKFNALAAH